MSSPDGSIRGPLLVNGLLILQRPDIDPLYDGPSTHRGVDGAQRLLPSAEQLIAANRVIDGSKDPTSVLAALEPCPGFRRIPTTPSAPVNLETYAHAIPEAAMYGWLAQKARSLQAPLSFGYAALLTMFAGLGQLSADNVQVRPTLYCCLIADKGVGKSRIQRRVRDSIRSEREYVRTTVPGSDRGLYEMFATDEQGGRANGIVLLQDELKQLLQKVNIQGSSLGPTLCSLFYEDEVSGAVKGKVCTARVQLSILGALKAADPQEFREMFGSETTAGLYDRFIFVPGPKKWEWDDEWTPALESRVPTRVTVPSSIYSMVKDWRRSEPEKERGRLGEIALRVAVISSSANRDGEVTPGAMTAALRFVEWQERIRAVYSPSEAKNDDAVVTNLILEAFTEYNKTHPGGWARFWDFARSNNWSRKYGPAVTRAKKSLIEDGMLEEETYLDEGNEERKVKNGGLRLRTS